MELFDCCCRPLVSGRTAVLAEFGQTGVEAQFSRLAAWKSAV